jgi:hypothetical protein
VTLVEQVTISVATLHQTLLMEHSHVPSTGLLQTAFNLTLLLDCLVLEFHGFLALVERLEWTQDFREGVGWI